MIGSRSPEKLAEWKGQAAIPEAHFVKAFNSIGNAFMVNPDFGTLRPSMFICGNNEQAKKTDYARKKKNYQLSLKEGGIQ